MSQPQRQIERVALDLLIQHPKNARRGNVALIAESLAEHGQVKPILVQQSTRYILAGNHTAQAAARLGWDEVDVIRLDVDDEQATRILLIDNKSADGAEYDEELLASLLEDLPDLAGTGYTEDDLDDLLISTQLPPPIPLPKMKDNGGKNVRSDVLAWGYLQWGSRRIQITPEEVERLNVHHDLYTQGNATDAGFAHKIADLVDAEQDIDSRPLAAQAIAKNQDKVAGVKNQENKRPGKQGRKITREEAEAEVAKGVVGSESHGIAAAAPAMPTGAVGKATAAGRRKASADVEADVEADVAVEAGA